MSAKKEKALRLRRDTQCTQCKLFFDKRDVHMFKGKKICKWCKWDIEQEYKQRENR